MTPQAEHAAELLRLSREFDQLAQDARRQAGRTLELLHPAECDRVAEVTGFTPDTVRLLAGHRERALAGV
jgi:hypothetical protein